jgi:hypothetical protein
MIGENDEILVQFRGKKQAAPEFPEQPADQSKIVRLLFV